VRILLVEPDADVRTRQAVALSAAGYRVKGAATFEAARQELVDDAPDLVVTAVRLAAFNGLQLVIRARAHNPPLPVVLTAAASDPALEAEARAHGAAFLAGSTNIDALVALVTDLLSDRRP
jgi:two-component system nitrogen regulation response regulator GlnG